MDPQLILAWRNFHLADRAVRDRLNARLASAAGGSLVEHDTLAWLAAAPEKRLRMLDLATRLQITQGGLTRIVDRLIRRDWVARDRPAENRREVYVTLTPSGAAAHHKARAVYGRVLEETLARHLDEPDLLALGAISGKLLDRIRSVEEDGPAGTSC